MDRVKGAFTLMGFVFKRNNEESPPITSAQVVYRKKNIRLQNRALKMPPQPRHTYFDVDPPQGNAVSCIDKVCQGFNFIVNKRVGSCFGTF